MTSSIEFETEQESRPLASATSRAPLPRATRSASSGYMQPARGDVDALVDRLALRGARVSETVDISGTH